MNPCMLTGFLLVSVLLARTAKSNPLIPSRIISGGEVAILQLTVRYNDQCISVSGAGFETFPGRTCGVAEIGFIDKEGRLFLKDVPYRISDPTPRTRARTVNFSVSVPSLAPPAFIFAQHRSTGGCEHAWSLQYGLEWLIYKIAHAGHRRA
jgi:hypothetical protein